MIVLPQAGISSAAIIADVAAALAAYPVPKDADIVTDVQTAMATAPVLANIDGACQTALGTYGAATATDVANAVFTLLGAIGTLPSDASITADVLAALASYGASKGNTWEKISGTTTFGAGVVVPSPGAILYTPTANLELIRGFVCQGNTANPMVAAGGATTLALGVKNAAAVTGANIVAARGFNPFNQAMMGDGVDVTLVPGGSMFVLGLAGATGAGSASRALRIFVDAGTASGAVDWVLERHVVIP